MTGVATRLADHITEKSPTRCLCMCLRNALLDPTYIQLATSTARGDAIFLTANGVVFANSKLDLHCAIVTNWCKAKSIPDFPTSLHPKLHLTTEFAIRLWTFQRSSFTGRTNYPISPPHCRSAGRDSSQPFPSRKAIPRRKKTLINSTFNNGASAAILNMKNLTVR